jgi:uroporphyrinogen-III synthase
MNILLTHQPGRLEGLEAALLAQGHTVRHQPAIRTEAIPAEAIPDCLLEPLLEPLHCDWWIFTSISAVQAAAQLGVFALPIPKIAVIGRGTAEALRRLGLQASLISPLEQASGLAQALLEHSQQSSGQFSGQPSRNRTHTWLKGNRSLPIFADQMREHGLSLREVIVYRTINQAIPEWPADAIVLSSPSAVAAIPATFNPKTQLIALGPSTLVAIQARGWQAIMATEASAHGVIQAMQNMPHGTRQPRIRRPRIRQPRTGQQ